MGGVEMNDAENKVIAEMFPQHSGKSIPEILAEMSNQEIIKSFFLLKNDPEAIQKRVLQDILNHAAHSQFGIASDFAAMKTVDDFRARLPITGYGDYQENIELMKKGQPDIQFNGETVRFIATSGTTGIPKLFPESKIGEMAKAVVSRIRLILLLSLAPEIMRPEKKVLSITNSAEYAKTESGIPIGSASGQAAKDIPREMQQKLILPVELILAKDLSNEDMDYLILLLALAEEHLAGVVCSNIAHFNMLLQKIAGFRDELLADISRGEISGRINISQELRAALGAKLTANPGRAEKLGEVFASHQPPEVDHIWPDFSVVSCWMAASSERIVNDVRRRLPSETKFLEWGYGASEGKFNIPSRADDPSGDLALFGYFFEFLPLGGKDTLLAHELQAGEYYEIIITSYSGLYRYNMQDIVYVKSVENQAPRIVFAAKRTEFLELNDLSLYIYQIDQDLKEASAQVQAELRFYQIMAENKEQRLVFIVEPFADDFPGQDFINALEKILIINHPVYCRLRENQRIKAAEVVVVAQGYRDGLFSRSLMPGKNVNQTKLKTIVEVYPDESSVINRSKGDA